MSIKQIIKRLKETKVLENYSFMTLLNIASALISLLIYPYVIRITGKDAYGTYIYALTIATYFQIFIDFGFSAPCAKAIVLHKDDIHERGKILTAVLTTQTALFILSSVVLYALALFIPFIKENLFVCAICLIQVFALSLYPIWYFQGMKKMKRVTYINLSCRLMSLPFIFIFVHSAADIWLYALITMFSILLGTLISYITIAKDGVQLQAISLSDVKTLMKEGTPFFLTSMTGTIKANLMKTIIKNLFGVGEVAIYDLADKIVNIPRLFTQNINAALFPEVVGNASQERVKQILRYERMIGFVFMLIIAALGYPAVLILGGKQMIGAFPLAVVLSMTIYSWLVVGAYLNFVFVPQNRYYHVTINQLMALVSCLLFAGVGVMLSNNIIAIAFAISLSGFVEIAYCRIICRKEKLL